MMASPGSAMVLKSASAGVLQVNGRGRGDSKSDDNDPLQAILNRSWNKQASRPNDTPNKPKRVLTSAGRVRLSGNGLSVNTKKDVQAYAAEDAIFLVGSGEATPSISAPTPKSTRRLGRQHSKGSNLEILPRKYYAFDLCPEVELSPTLRSPPRVRRGSVKLVFNNDEKCIADELKQSEQEKFVDLVHRLQSLVSQAALRLNDMVVQIRKRIREDTAWASSQANHDRFAEVSFEILTANYYLAKWHHQLEPNIVQAPTRPAKIEDMPVNDIMAEVQSSIARMEILTAKLVPVLNKIVNDARNMRRGPDGQPLTPNGKDPLKLAAKRGFKDVADMYHLVEHLEHLLAETHHLAHPPTSGLENCRKAVRDTTNVILAAGAFKKLMHKSDDRSAGTLSFDAGNVLKKALNKSDDRKSDVEGSISAAFKTIGSAVMSIAEEAA